MKYTILFLTMKKTLVFFPLIFILFFCTTVTKKNKSSFFYVNNEKIELIIPGDTIGVILNTKIKLPNGFTESSKNKINSYADSVISSHNYKPVGYMPGADNIKLLLSRSTKKSTSSLEQEAGFLKSAQFSNFIINSGYLARIKKTNKPVLVTNEIIVFFNPGTSDTLINQIFSQFGLTIKEHKRLAATEYLVFLNDRAQYDVLETSHKLKEISSVKFAQVNLIYVKNFMEVDPDYSAEQWNINNDGRFASDAEFDGDIDANKAWEQYTTGTDNTLIAILDGGFDIWHADLHDNIFYNRAEMIGQADYDDDDNGYIDDTVGWNFTYQTAEVDMFSKHGTAVAGIVAAKKNDFGITGVCPDCKMLLLQTTAGAEIARDGMAFRYAINMRSKIINCSWILDYMDFIPDNIRQAIDDAESQGIIVICALDNYLPQANCDNKKDLYSLPNTLCVSRSTCKDIFDNTCYANFIDLVAPTAAMQDARGILKIYTTDITGNLGYNGNSLDCFKPTTIDRDYTGCFLGTSASTPQVSGTAALVFSINPTISVKQMRYLLQDCADKIDTLNGHYSARNGYSNYEILNFGSSLGYGRLNTYEAVKIAAPIERGGRNGVDIFLRDNYLDWGNTEQPSHYLFNSPRGDRIGHYRSQDIKVDAPDASNNYRIPPANSIEFENFADEKPMAGKINKAYVRVHNRGFKTAADVKAKLYWVYGGTALPSLWNTFPNDLPGDPIWNFLGSVTLTNLEYSGASVANTTEDKSQIASYSFTAPIPTPGLRNHYCFAALVDSPEDPITPSDFTGIISLDEVTPNFNNVTHRNYSIEILAGADDNTSDMLEIRNPFPFPAPTKISIINPNQIKIYTDGVPLDSIFTMRAKSERKLILKIDRKAIQKRSEIRVMQEIMLPGNKKIFGGFDFVFN